MTLEKSQRTFQLTAEARGAWLDPTNSPTQLAAEKCVSPPLRVPRGGAATAPREHAGKDGRPLRLVLVAHQARPQFR
jgi:hypothetical protein